MEEELKNHGRFQRWYNSYSDNQKWIVRNGFSVIYGIIILFIVTQQYEDNWVKSVYKYYVMLLYLVMSTVTMSYLYLNKIDVRRTEDETWAKYRKAQLIYIIVGSVGIVFTLTNIFL